MSKLASKYFSSSGTWTAPAGVTKVLVLAHGGGAGGNGGRNATGDQSLLSASTTPYLVELTVTPNTTYTITIGTGGTGGVARTTSTATAGAGGDTTFGALWTFRGGFPDSGYYGSTAGPSGQTIDIGHLSGRSYYEYKLFSGFVNGLSTLGTSSGSYTGGQAGPPGYYGSVGGTGGNGNSSGTGGTGGNATGFGAAGGAGGNGTTGGAGGSGAPGQMWVMWVE